MIPVPSLMSVSPKIAAAQTLALEMPAPEDFLCGLGRGKSFAPGWIHAGAVKAKGCFPAGLMADCGPAVAWELGSQSQTLPKCALEAVCCEAVLSSAGTGMGAGLRLLHPSGMLMALPGGNRSCAPKHWVSLCTPAYCQCRSHG